MEEIFSGFTADIFWLLCWNFQWFTKHPVEQMAVLVTEVTTNWLSLYLAQEPVSAQRRRLKTEV